MAKKKAKTSEEDFLESSEDIEELLDYLHDMMEWRPTSNTAQDLRRDEVIKIGAQINKVWRLV